MSAITPLIFVYCATYLLMVIALLPEVEEVIGVFRHTTIKVNGKSFIVMGENEGMKIKEIRSIDLGGFIMEDFVRDDVMYAAIFGMFSFCWFGWAQENPKKSWRKYIGIASGIALLVCLYGVYLSITHWNDRTALSETDAYTRYLIFVFIEFALAAIGAFLLIKWKRYDYIAPWIAFIVGIHFFWLKDIFKDSSLNILAVLLIAVVIISLFLSRKLNVANSAITGIGAGSVLFCFAILGLVRFFMV